MYHTAQLQRIERHFVMFPFQTVEPHDLIGNQGSQYASHSVPDTRRAQGN